MKTSFREHMRTIFDENYAGLDDVMPDCETSWFAEIDPDNVIEWAEHWGQVRFAEGIKEGQRRVNEAINTVFNGKAK